MTILVTGADGFIGSHLCLSLNRLDFHVIQHQLSNGDLSDPDSLSYLGTTKIDHIIHLAALNFVPESWTNTFVFFKANVLGTLNILELCKLKKASVTFISSYLYGNPLTLPITELHPLQMANPYMLTKKMGEELCQFYYENFHIHCNVIRPFNIYGPGQNEEFLIPKIVLNAIRKSPIQVFDFRPKRDFLFVDDFVELIICSIRHINGFNIYNAGSGSSYSVQEIIEIVSKLLGGNVSYESLKRERINEILDVKADIQKAKDELGWIPKTPISEGLRILIDKIDD
jgi:nucleoside-diphosphate-sugar epimerase